MSNFDFYNGFQESGFLNNEVKLPALTATQKQDLAPVKGVDDAVLRYMNYSVMQSKSRRLPYFTASNINGELFRKLKRKDNWRKDSRIAADHQWGSELYGADNSDFDRGHMTKREDVQWGDNEAIAKAGADSTFFYTNSVPQHAKLNQKIWLELEDYILHTETSNNGLRVSVFTGPVLHSKDPLFITSDDIETTLPMLFWKVVYFEKSDGKLYRAAFMMSQSSLMYINGIVEDHQYERVEESTDEDDLFLSFEHAETYQVDVKIVEKLTGFKFHSAKDVYQGDEKLKLILEQIDVQESLNESADASALFGLRIVNMQL